MSPPTVANFDAEIQAKLNMLTHLENEQSKRVFCLHKQKNLGRILFPTQIHRNFYIWPIWIVKGQEISDQIFVFSFPPRKSNYYFFHYFMWGYRLELSCGCRTKESPMKYVIWYLLKDLLIKIKCKNNYAQSISVVSNCLRQCKWASWV